MVELVSIPFSFDFDGNHRNAQLEIDECANGDIRYRVTPDDEVVQNEFGTRVFYRTNHTENYYHDGSPKLSLREIAYLRRVSKSLIEFLTQYPEYKFLPNS